MSALLRTTLAIIAILTGAHSAWAELNSKQRVNAFKKLPDWSGVWERFNAGLSGAPADPKELAQFMDAFAESRPPYNTEWEAKYQLALKRHKESPQVPPTVCNGVGFPDAMMFPPEMIQIAITPEETTFMFYSGGVRHVTANGRHPPVDERWPTPWGDSIGTWEGQTLVIDTVASNAPIWMDGPAAPLSEQVHVIERIKNLDRNTLENVMTIDDPVALAHPWTLKIQYHRVAAMPHLAHYDCASNDRNPVVNGGFVITPAP